MQMEHKVVEGRGVVWRDGGGEKGREGEDRGNRRARRKKNVGERERGMGEGHRRKRKGEG